MATCLFRSPLAFRLQSFLDVRRAAGRKDVGTARILRNLDGFLCGDLKSGDTITRDVADRWIRSMAHLCVNTRINQISVLRQFCAYLRHFDPRTCIVHRSFLPHRCRPAPYIYSFKEVRRILAAARRIGPPGSLRPAVLYTLIGLLYTTGIRIGEALRLTLADIDPRRRLLLVRETKFRKTRLVPLSESATRSLCAFLRRRRLAGFPTAPSAAVFVNPQGRAYGAPRICAVLLEILRCLGIRAPSPQRGPRIHDFRHTFAVHRLMAWYREGANVPAKLPLLSTYLGHSTLIGTEAYLHATAELLEHAGRRFHDFFLAPALRREKSHVGPG